MSDWMREEERTERRRAGRRTWDDPDPATGHTPTQRDRHEVEPPLDREQS